MQREDREDDYGLIRPSLIRQLRAILDQYPDDGQILKELIQNAEDAEAKKVVFLYDQHSHPTQHLHHPDMAPYQGPALYAYNDAVFKEKDWTGIRMLQDSVKEKDPMKVGRFGLGFKSVLHMTDLPNVISADRLYFIDPHEKFFQFDGEKTSGYRWHLVDKKKDLRRVTDHVKPFLGLFGCSPQVVEDGFYQGTIFRFPLRQESSRLSPVVYSQDKMESLFRNFERDAHNVLLFLKHLQVIELQVRTSTDETPRVVFKVELSPSCLPGVRDKRLSFLQQLRERPQEDVNITYMATTCTQKMKPGEESEVHKRTYLINEYHLGERNSSPNLRKLQKDPNLCLTPLVGVAMEMKHVNNAADNEDFQPTGHVFCFLPLPMEQTTSTGLPVHVNGFFAISQDRRHIKWPTAGQNFQGDKFLHWNRCLLQEVIPLSYVQLVKKAVQLSKNNPNVVLPETVYRMIPDIVCVDERWKILLDQFLVQLFTLPVFHSPSNGGRWLKVEECYFDCLKEEPSVQKIVVSTLLQLQVNVVKVPPHVLHAIGTYTSDCPEVITPGICRNFFRHRDFSAMATKEKQLLLKFLLKDEDFVDMEGLVLLPSADGCFTEFSKNKPKVYAPTEACPRQLLPGFEKSLISADLDDALTLKLLKMANEGCCQLKPLNASLVSSIIPTLLPKSWAHQQCVEWDPSKEDHFPEEWLSHFWNFLRKNFPNNINNFTGLPLIPLNSGFPMKLVQLSLDTRVMSQTAMGLKLSTGVTRMLEKMDVFIVRDLPEFVTSHAAVLGNYVSIPFPDDVLQVMYNVYIRADDPKHYLELIRHETSREDKEEMLEFLSKLQIRELTGPLKDFLSSLPLFTSTWSTAEKPDFVSCKEVPQSGPVHKLPVKISSRFIDVTSEPARQVAKVCGVVDIPIGKLMRTTVLTEFCQGKVDQERAETTAVHIFKNFHLYSQEDPEMLKMLSTVPFVVTEQGRINKPCDLCDPEIEELVQLVADQDAFPGGIFKQPENLVLLRKMGLKSIDTIKPLDVLRSMIHIEELSQVEETVANAVVKATSVLQFLGRNHHYLFEDVNGQLLIEWARDIEWVPTLQEKPALLPSELPLSSCPAVVKPDRVKTSKWLPVIGSEHPVLKFSVDTNIEEAFGWNSPPDTDVVMAHLKNVVAAYTASDKARFLALVTSIYEELQKRDPAQIVKCTENVQTWIWYGNGFTESDNIIYKKAPVDLAPFVYCLPPEMEKFSSFFLRCGILKECNSDLLMRVLCDIKSNGKDDTGADSTRDLQLAIDILNLLVDYDIPDKVKETILVPVQGSEDCVIEMLPAREVTYCDIEWVRQGYDLMTFDKQDGVIFIHPNLPTKTAERLQVPTLMSRMLHAEELDITGFGQAEPLTDRLRKLLEDYTDGLAIPKELIQNADDAGASQFKILYDERSNEDAMKFLIDEEMKECQGPAIWVYNDALFTEDDFKSITKLGGATKEEQEDKIGQFGLGFNAVYNITDVPSFISGENLVIFDPHMTHLGKGIKDKTKPGIKINMNRNRTLLRKLPHQFLPYLNVFDCKVSSTEEKPYFKGTLFRLPLRTRKQANKSEICNTFYDKGHVEKLLQMFIATAQNMLIFTQNVKQISVHHLMDGNEPGDATCVFELNKSVVHLVRPIAIPKLDAQNTAKLEEASTKFLEHAGKFMKTKRNNPDTKQCSPSCSMVLKNSATFTESVEINLQPPSSLETFWLVSSGMGRSSSLEIALSSHKHLLPLAGTAMRVQPLEESYVPFQQEHLEQLGRAFCFLPLPVATGLPVHINAPFAIQSNRRQLYEVTEDDKQTDRLIWNIALLEDAVLESYMNMINDLRRILPKNESIDIHNIWPSSTEAAPYFEPLVKRFYERVASCADVAIFQTDSKLMTYEDTTFLHPEFARDKDIETLVKDTFCSCMQTEAVMTIPEHMLECFKFAGVGEVLTSKIYDKLRFYEEVFFPNISGIESRKRDPLLLFALNQHHPALDKLIVTHACIPVTPDGNTLCFPSRIVHPSSPAARIFTPADGRFPFGDDFQTPSTLKALQNLGMKMAEVSWDDIVEAANNVSSVPHDLKKTGPIIEGLLFFIDKRLVQHERLIKAKHDDYEHHQNILNDYQNKLAEIPFVPVLSKPATFPVCWIGSREEGLKSPNELFPRHLSYLVSSTRCIADDEGMSEKVKHFLMISKKQAPVESVMVQMEHAITLDPASITEASFSTYRKIMHKVYEHLQVCSKENEDVANTLIYALQDKQWILVDKQLLRTDQVALMAPCTEVKDLVALPAELRRKSESFFTKVGVKDEFTVETYIKKLGDMKEEHGDKPLKGKALNAATQLVGQITYKLRNPDNTDQTKKESTLYIPNTKGVLHPSSDLCYNDCPWIKENAALNCTHPDITYQMATSMGVRTKRQEALSKYAKGIPFGQRENLSNSLKRVLSGYPCDHGIMKELVQNADDAHATEIHFVLDPRNHPTKQVFEESWKPLQGPALCVYNDRPFTDHDLEGIQNFGQGSKRADADKTGQYGIGFSTVYHLTDAPSLLTRREGIGETLCVFDPLCMYVPGATHAEPGMRYDDVPTLRGAFPDVFGCYMEDKFAYENSTMFRFPLRDQKMASLSEISKIPMTINRLQLMLENLKEEAFEMLLFSNSLEQISVSEVCRETGKLINTHTYKAMISKADKQKKKELNNYCSDIAQQFKDGTIAAFLDVALREVSYHLFMTDNHGRHRKWFITQRVGFEKGTIVPGELENALASDQMCLLPRGGVASLVENRNNMQYSNESFRGKAFCILPLPLMTGLPVHINGHFSLDNENRRHLWPSEEQNSLKKVWNDLLCETVIAPAYAEHLRSARLRRGGWIDDITDDQAKVSCQRIELDGCVKSHQNLFPIFAENDQWELLKKAFYIFVADNHIPLFPSVKDTGEQQVQPDGGIICNFEVLWMPPCGEGSRKGFFSREEPQEVKASKPSLFKSFKKLMWSSPRSLERTDFQVLRDVLSESGFKVLEAKQAIVDQMLQVEAPLNFLSPSGVLDFFLSYSSDDPACLIGDLPLPVAETPFHNENTLMIVLRYCSKNSEFCEKMHNLPMLLTQDDKLRVFDANNPAIHSDFMDLLPNSPHLFLKPSMAKELFTCFNPEDCSVLRQLDIDTIAEHLPENLSEDLFCSGTVAVKWGHKDLKTRWLDRFWLFVNDVLKPSVDTEEQDVAFARSQALEKLKPLQNWNLIPAQTETGDRLLQIKMGHEIVYFPIGDNRWPRVREIFRKIIHTKLNTLHLCVNSVSAATLLVTTLDQPGQVLDLIYQEVTRNPGISAKCTPAVCSDMLVYFSDNLTALLEENTQKNEESDSDGDTYAEPDLDGDTYAEPDSDGATHADTEDKPTLIDKRIQQIRSLPFYTTIFGDVISLVDALVYTLPAQIPTSGVDVWQSKSGTVFLARNELLQPLYDFIGCANISVLEVYCKFIFQHLEYFPTEDRLLHLHHVYKTYIRRPNNALSEEERDLIVETLKEVPIIEDSSGTLLPVCEFYDPENTLFQVLLPDHFPPRAKSHFKDSEWHDFLCELGLKKEISRDEFMQFTKQVAYEAQGGSNDAALTKSKMLVQHLFAMPCHLRDDILPEISDIPFIAPKPANEYLVEIFPQHGDMGNHQLPFVKFRDSVSSKYEKVVWTRASILPYWADPCLQNFQTENTKQVTELLQVQKPNVDLVLSHMSNLTDYVSGCKVPDGKAKALMQVFKELYQYLQDEAVDSREVISRLRKMPCVLVNEGRHVTTPDHVVMHLNRHDEFEPHVYRLPFEYGVFRPLLEKIGVSETLSANHCAVVLQELKKTAGSSQLIPSEMSLCFKATNGLLTTLQQEGRTSDVTTDSLFLPSESGILVDAKRLVYNDAPSYYERAQKCGLQFVTDLKDCGLSGQNTEDVLQSIPESLRPGMLSVYVKEHLTESVKKSVSATGLAQKLDKRIKSEVFYNGVARLVRHEAYRRDQKLDDAWMHSKLERLSTISIFSVDKVETFLTFRDRKIDGSEAEKSCFVERIRGNESSWNVYIRSDATMGEDLLIPLADIINSILGGMLYNSVLYLLPIMSCPDVEITNKLNSLNIRLDKSQVSRKRAILPKAGQVLVDEHKRYLQESDGFKNGDFVAYIAPGEADIVYAVVKEEVESPDDRVYLINVGGAADDAIIAGIGQLRKFGRN